MQSDRVGWSLNVTIILGDGSAINADTRGRADDAAATSQRGFLATLVANHPAGSRIAVDDH